MSPQRRAALVSVCAAAGLIVLKLVTGLATDSLGLVSEAVHSGVDLVAALLTFFALRVAARPADPSHQYGHGKAEHLAALAEGGFLVLASVVIGARAVQRLTDSSPPTVNAAWYALAVVGIVIVVDASRMAISWRTARRYGSAALASNAVHFGSDLLGTLAVLVGLFLARAGHPEGDSIAALFVSVLVLLAAGALMKRNVDVLMDRAPLEAEETARRAIDNLVPAVQLRRLRMRQAGGRQFADVVIGVPAGSAVGQGHAAADAVEAAVEAALPGSDVVVHVEPLEDEELRERAHAAALTVPGVQEIHNLALLEVGGRTELSLHLKLPGHLTLVDAHEVAERVERAICAAVPEIDTVQTHLEPLTEPTAGSEVDADSAAVERIVRDTTGQPPRELRFLRTEGGLVAFLTLGLEPTSRLDEAHSRASEIEERIRRARPDIVDVIVHTEP